MVTPAFCFHQVFHIFSVWGSLYFCPTYIDGGTQERYDIELDFRKQDLLYILRSKALLLICSSGLSTYTLFMWKLPLNFTLSGEHKEKDMRVPMELELFTLCREHTRKVCRFI